MGGGYAGRPRRIIERMKKLLLTLLALGILWYLAKNFGLLPASSSGNASTTTAPIERARTAAAANDARTAAGQGVAREADQPSNGGVTENMTPDQVRALLGSPDEVTSEGSREIWTYRNVGKTVTFENGVATSVR
jgi:hypothetical protein